jgi:TM2 domain-containing membrane protein YozV
MTMPQPPSNDPSNSTPPPQYSPPPLNQAPLPYQPLLQYLADAQSKKMLAGLMAIFFGNLGIHKFVLGYTTAGVITLLINLTCIGAPIIRIISFIEGIIYLTKTDEQFYQMYIVNKKEWF